MKNPTTFAAVTILAFFLCAPILGGAQNGGSLKERGYQALSIKASYAFFNDLQELTDAGTFENVTAGYRVVEGAYEILIDFGWMEEILYVDFIEWFPAGAIANGIEYQRSVYGDGREEVVATLTINNRMAVYSDEKKVVP